MPIKQWAMDDRPREKLLMKGPQALSNSELIAILIRTGGRNRPATDLAKEILELCKNDLGKLGRLSLPDLMKIKGMGQAKTITLAAALELGRRRLSTLPVAKEERITSSKDIINMLQPLLMDHQYEVFVAVFLNNAHVIQEITWLSKGGIDRAIVDVRILLQKALELQASAIILCHNHPSGSLMPSKADLETTERVRKAAKCLEIRLLDHIILGGNGYFSLADQGYLKSFEED
jgi:DNA repair protein RadC